MVEEEEHINFFAQWDEPPPEPKPKPAPVVAASPWLSVSPAVLSAAPMGAPSRLPLPSGTPRAASGAAYADALSGSGNGKGPQGEAEGEEKRRRRKKKPSGGDGELLTLLTHTSLADMRLHDSQPPLSTMGLVNSGNACFRNVVLQSLLALPPLVALLRSLPQLDGALTGALVDGVYWRELFAFFVALQPPDLRSSLPPHTHTPASAVVPDDSFPLTFRHFREQTGGIADAEGAPLANTQEDAMEFLTFLLDALHEEARSANGCGDLPAASSPLPASKEAWNEVRQARARSVVDTGGRAEALGQISATPVSRLFHGLYRSEVLYTLKRVTSVTFQRYHCISLDLTEGGAGRHVGGGRRWGQTTDVGQAMAAHFREEDLAASSIRKVVLLERLPAVLVLQLKRFAFDVFYATTTKIDSSVVYSARLQLDPAHLSAALRESSDDCVYELQAAVLHHGATATGGHYTAVCKDAYRQWRHLDDAKVTAVTEAEALAHASEVYLLFYCLVGK